MTGERTDEALRMPAAPVAPLGSLGILRIRPFLVLYLNAAAIFLGVMAQTVARGWLAFELTGSNAALGGVLLAFGVTLLVVTPWGGVAADRLPKRLVLQISVSVLAASSAWIGLAVGFDVIEYWMLLGAGALQAFGFALFNPARMALLAEMLPSGPVPAAVSLLLVNTEVSRVVGPAVAGLLIGSLAFGVEAVFLASAVIAMLGALLTVALPRGNRRGEPGDRSPLGELVDGLRYVRAHSDLAALLWVGIGVTMTGLPYLAFLPAVANDLFGLGPFGYGVLSATPAVGAVIGGLLLGRRSYRGRENRLLIWSGAVLGLALVGMAAAPTFAVGVAALLVIGAGFLAFQTTNQSMLIALSDLEYHGRIQGLVMLSFGAFGIAALPLGLLADVIGLRWTLGGMGAAVVLVVALYAVLSRHRAGRRERLRDLG